MSCSQFFRDLVQSCGKQPSSDDLGQDQGSASETQTSKAKDLLEIPLPDEEEEIKALVEHLHQPDQFLGSIVPVMTKEGAAKVQNLAPVAFKYNKQGYFISLTLLWNFIHAATEFEVLEHVDLFLVRIQRCVIVVQEHSCLKSQL
jgi:hypothetical protein